MLVNPSVFLSQVWEELAGDSFSPSLSDGRRGRGMRANFLKTHRQMLTSRVIKSVTLSPSVFLFQVWEKLAGDSFSPSLRNGRRGRGMRANFLKTHRQMLTSRVIKSVTLSPSVPLSQVWERERPENSARGH